MGYGGAGVMGFGGAGAGCGREFGFASDRWWSVFPGVMGQARFGAGPSST